MRPAILLPLLSGVLLGCHHPAEPDPAVPTPGFTLISVNDTYRIEGLAESGVGGMARLRTLRAATEGPVLVLHGGDFLYPSFLSRSYDGAQMIDALNRLDGDAAAFDPWLFVVPGNHEFEKTKEKDAAKVDARLSESGFTWLLANQEIKTDAAGEPVIGGENLLPRAIVEIGGMKVGIFGVTIERKAAYLGAWEDPIAAAKREVETLRSHGAEFVVALTHLDVTQDRALLEALPGESGPDLVIGGHNHEAMTVDVGGRYILKGDADAITAQVVKVAGKTVTPTLVRLGPSDPVPDPALQTVVDGWVAKHQTEFCTKATLPDGCLDTALGRATVNLRAEEMEIRRFETNLGDWLSDLTLAAHREGGAQVVLLNSGSMRINHDIPAGPITRRHVEELLPYGGGTRIIDVPGKVLRDEITRRSVESWSGNGHFLQIAGMGFTFDPAAGTVRDVWIQDGDKRRPITDGETVRAVVADYLADPKLGDQDGYTMITPAMVRGEGKLVKDLMIQALAASPNGISPKADGRICNTSRQTCP